MDQKCSRKFELLIPREVSRVMGTRFRNTLLDSLACHAFYVLFKSCSIFRYTRASSSASSNALWLLFCRPVILNLSHRSSRRFLDPGKKNLAAWRVSNTVNLPVG